MANINGTPGNDNLIGTPEIDGILGGLGDDILTGGDGADNFIFNDVIDTVQNGGETYVYSTDGFDIIKDLTEASITNVSLGNNYPYHISIPSQVAGSAKQPDSAETKYILEDVSEAIRG